MARSNRDAFESKFITLKIDTDNERIRKVYGKYQHHCAIFAFSLALQNGGSYLYRGSIRAIGETGRVLKARKKDTGAEQAVSTAVYCNAADIDTLKKVIEEL